MRLRPYSSTALATGGAILAALGLYFAFVRPALLPEDARFMGASAAVIQASLPGIAIWLRRLFKMRCFRPDQPHKVEPFHSSIPYLHQSRVDFP